MGLLFPDAAPGASLDAGTVAALKANSGLGETASGGKWTWEKGQTVFGSDPNGNPTGPVTAPGFLAFHPAGQGPGEDYYKYDENTGAYAGSEKGSKVQSYASGVLSVAAFAVGANAIFGNADLGIQGIAGGSTAAPASTSVVPAAPSAASDFSVLTAAKGAGSIAGAASSVGSLFRSPVTGKPSGNSPSFSLLPNLPAQALGNGTPTPFVYGGGSSPSIVGVPVAASAAAAPVTQGTPGLSPLEMLAAVATVIATAYQLLK